MSRNGSGTYGLPTGNPVVTGTAVSSTVHNATMNDIAAEITNSVARDGQAAMTGALDMGTQKVKNAGSATLRTDLPTTAQVQDGAFIYVSSVGGTADAITLAPSPAVTSYVAGQTFRFVASGANTGAVTVAVSALATKAITKAGSTALIAGDIPSGALIEITYDGTRFQMRIADAATRTGTETISNKTISNSFITSATGINVTNASNPAVEIHKPSAASGQWYINSSNLLALAQTNGSGTVTADRMTVNLSTGAIAGDVVATASEMETGTSTSKIVTPGLLARHPAVPKAWALVTFSGGTPSLAANYGISGITDNGVGDVTVSFSTAFSGTSYAVMITPQANSVFLFYPSVKQTGDCRILLFSMTGGGSAFPAIDANFAVSFYGDQ